MVLLLIVVAGDNVCPKHDDYWQHLAAYAPRTPDDLSGLAIDNIDESPNLSLTYAVLISRNAVC